MHGKYRNKTQCMGRITISIMFNCIMETQYQTNIGAEYLIGNAPTLVQVKILLFLKLCRWNCIWIRIYQFQWFYCVSIPFLFHTVGLPRNLQLDAHEDISRARPIHKWQNVGYAETDLRVEIFEIFTGDCFTRQMSSPSSIQTLFTFSTPDSLLKCYTKISSLSN